MGLQITAIIMCYIFGCINICYGNEQSDKPKLTFEQLSFLDNHAQKIGLHCRSADECDRLLQITEIDYRDENKNALLRVLQYEIDYSFLINNLPTKNNLRKAIIMPEKWDVMYGPELRLRPIALFLLSVNDDFKQDDLKFVHQSFNTAIHWKSKIWALYVIAKYDYKTGMRMVKDFMWSEDYRGCPIHC